MIMSPLGVIVLPFILFGQLYKKLNTRVAIDNVDAFQMWADGFSKWGEGVLTGGTHSPQFLEPRASLPTSSVRIPSSSSSGVSKHFLKGPDSKHFWFSGP